MVSINNKSGAPEGVSMSGTLVAQAGAHQNFIFAPWTKVPLEQFLHGQESSLTNVPWTKVSLANCHLDKCSNPTR